MTARVASVNVSPGGVPKRDVGTAFVGLLGVEGDGHDSPGHGGRDAAVCLYTIEAIGRVAADGHRAFPGAFGENLTLEGLELGGLSAGDRLAFEPGGLVLELTKPTAPCKTIGHFFKGEEFARISPQTNPADARWYARVLAEGRVSVGDRVEVVAGAEGDKPQGDRAQGETQ